MIKIKGAEDIVNSINTGVNNFLKDLSYYPTGAPYMPDATKEALPTRFARGLGIGFQEGAKNMNLPFSSSGYQPHRLRAPNSDGEFHLGYSKSILEKIKDTAFGPHRNVAEDLGTNSRQMEIPGLWGKEGQVVPDSVDQPSLVGYEMGRMASDIVGHGLRKMTWNLQGEDMLGTAAGLLVGNPKALDRIGLEASPGLSNAVRFGTGAGLGLAVGNWDITNVTQGGRPQGYEAVSADEDDPRKSTQPAIDLLVNRGLLGRNARLLPWQQFREERPEVTYQEYDDYKQYLYNRNPGLLNKATLGIVKGDPDGLDGDSPELRIVGYRLTPEGILGAGVGAAIPIAVTKAIRNASKVT